MSQRRDGRPAPNGAGSFYPGSDGRWHGRITVGVRDDGRPDRRHVTGRSEKEVQKKARDIDKARDEGHLQKPGQGWTVEQWLAHWVENIAAPTVRPSTLAGYRFAVYKHLTPPSGPTCWSGSNPNTWRRCTSGCWTPAGHRPPPTRRTARSRKNLLQESGVREVRLHDARHTAATVLLLLGVPERVVMSLMGWSHSSMATRYQHLTEAIRADVAERVGGLLWHN